MAIQDYRHQPYLHKLLKSIKYKWIKNQPNNFILENLMGHTSHARINAYTEENQLKAAFNRHQP